MSVTSPACMSTFISKEKLLPRQMKLFLILSGGINSLLTVRYDLSCVDNTPFFLILNVLHLSSQTIIFAHLHHFAKRFNRSWLHLVWLTRAESYTNQNQLGGANELQNLYPIQWILSTNNKFSFFFFLICKLQIYILYNIGRFTRQSQR